MVDLKILGRATLVGIVLQAILAVVIHFAAWIPLFGQLFATMMISATAGYLYAMDLGKGYFNGMTGGAIAGGLCGGAGIVVTLALGDVPGFAIPIGAAVAVLTGTVGGLFGQMAAVMRSLERRR
jgi:hypothetical protein